MSQEFSTASSSNKKRYNFVVIGLAVWTPAGFTGRNVSSVRVGLANGTKRTPSQNWGNLLPELHVPHKQCLTGIFSAFSASLTSIWPSFPRFHCTRRHLPSAVPWISEDCLLPYVSLSNPSCANKQETVIHFVFQCPEYDQLRSKYLPDIINVHDPRKLLITLMNSNSQETILNVANFPVYAFNLRSSKLDANT